MLSEELRQTVFIVMPAYNEGPAIEAVIRTVGEVYPNVVVIDDGSRDNTFDVARTCARHVLRHPVNRGQGAALQTGIDYALQQGADYIVTFDSDGQHRVEDVENLITPIINGDCDIALGSRFLGQEAVNMPKSRLVLLKASILFTRVMSRIKLTDTHNGLRAFSRQAAQQIQITLDRMAHASELIDLVGASGLPFLEVPVTIRYTDYSLEKGQSARDALRVLIQYLLGRVMP